MKTLFLVLRSIVYMSGFLLFWGWITLRVRAFDRSLGILLPGAVEIPGVILVSVGLVLALACASVFVLRGRGTPAVFDAPRTFVATGPYKYVRNPMYVGGMMLLVGFGLSVRSVSVLALALVLFALLHMFVVFYEEPALARRFGVSYEDYRRTVRRWLPRRRR